MLTNALLNLLHVWKRENKEAIKIQVQLWNLAWGVAIMK